MQQTQHSGTASSTQLSLFDAQPQFELSPVGLFHAPHSEIAAAVLFPLPLAHLGHASGYVPCRGLLVLRLGHLLAVDFRWAHICRPTLWGDLARYRRRDEPPTYHMRRGQDALLRNIDRIDGWPHDFYLKSKQFDRLCDVVDPVVVEPGADGEKLNAQTERAKADIQLRLQEAVTELLSVRESLSFNADSEPHRREWTVERILSVRRDLPVNLWGDLTFCAAVLGQDARARLQKACEDWPLDLLQCLVDAFPHSGESALWRSLLEGTSLASELAGAGVARPVSRRVMRLGRHFPSLGSGLFRRTLAAASDLSADRLPLDQMQWAAFASIHRASAPIHPQLRDSPVATRLRDWAWRGPHEPATECAHRLRDFDKLLNIVAGGDDFYTQAEVVQVADWMLARSPERLFSLETRIRRTKRDIRLYAMTRACGRVGVHDLVHMLDELLDIVPEVPEFIADHGLTFRVCNDATTLIELGRRLGNCLEEPQTCIEYIIHEFLLVSMRQGAAGSGIGVVAMKLPAREGSPAHSSLFHEMAVSTKRSREVKELSACTTKFAAWFEAQVTRCSDLSRFRSAIARVNDAISTEVQAIDRLAYWRGVLGRRIGT